MKAELALLDKNVSDDLKILTDLTDIKMSTIMGTLIDIYNVINGLVSAGYGASSVSGGSSVDAITNGFSNAHKDASDLYKLTKTNQTDTMKMLDKWNNAFGVWYDLDEKFQHRLVEGLTLWGTTSTAQLSGILNAVGGAPAFADGGYFSGPTTGSMAKMHGNELVLSQKAWTPVNVKGAADGYKSDPEVKDLLKAVLVELGKPQNVGLTVKGGERLDAIIRRTANDLDTRRAAGTVKGRGAY
jgi:hypothetical protein